MKTLSLIVLTILFEGNSYAQYNSTAEGFYFGAGTSVSSYVGGYFGNAYQMRVFSDNSDYDDYGYSYSYYETDYDYDYFVLWSPVQFDAALGNRLTDNLSIELAASFIFHFNGRVDPELSTVSVGSGGYQDRNDYASLYAVPVSVSLKLHSSGDDGQGYFIKIGPAWQYTSEQYDRVREYYSYEKYYYHSSTAYLGTVSKTKWLPGITTSMGVQLDLAYGISSYTEIEYSYFKISGSNNSTALALDRAKEAQLLSLKTKVFFSF